MARSSQNPGPTITVPATLRAGSGGPGYMQPKPYAITARIIRPGDRYGRDDCLVHTGEEGFERGDLIEFSITEGDGEFGWASGWMRYTISQFFDGDEEREIWWGDDVLMPIGQDGYEQLYLDAGVKGQLREWARALVSEPA